MKTLLLDLPFSRKCEIEADYIGLLLMARACYDPKNAISFWERMSQKNHKEIVDFVSTHPSHSKRIENISSWLPEAEAIFQNSNCYNSFIDFTSRWP
jgi:predicted Zn-dependent protease